MMNMQCLLFIFVQRGLQQAERVHQSWGKAALLSWRPSEPRPLGHVPIQVKLLLCLFTDQLSLPGKGHAHTDALLRETSQANAHKWTYKNPHSAVPCRWAWGWAEGPEYSRDLRHDGGRSPAWRRWGGIPVCWTEPPPFSSAPSQ